MTNPEIKQGKTPNGGDYSEFWYMTINGETAKDMESATHFKIYEKTNDGRIVQTIYGVLTKS